MLEVDQAIGSTSNTTLPLQKRLVRACFMLLCIENSVMSNLNMANNNWIDHSSMIRFSFKNESNQITKQGILLSLLWAQQRIQFHRWKDRIHFFDDDFFWNCRKLFRCKITPQQFGSPPRLTQSFHFQQRLRNKNKKSWIASRWCSKLAPEHLIYWHSTDQRIFKPFDQRLKGIKVDCRPCARLVPFLKSNIYVKWLCSFFPFIQQGAKKSHYYDVPNAYLNEELVIF